MFEDILLKIRPTEQEEVVMNRVASKLYGETLKQIRQYPEIKVAEYQGSYAKNTWLTGDSDLDLFLIFDRKTAEKDFKRISLEVGFLVINNLEGQAYTRYADHPFVEGEIDGVKINIVPCYDSPVDSLRSDTDRTPYHTKYMVDKLREGKNDEVRLLKHFLKVHKLYGSDIRIQGFSGYSCEVLVDYYGSFDNVLKGMSNIKEGQIIINKSGVKILHYNTPITIIDPIDSNRNLASAFSKQNIGKFILLSREVIRNPYLTFSDNVDLFNTDKVGEKLKLTFSKYEASPDKIWGQIKKAESAIKTQLKQVDFEPLLSESEIKNDLVYVNVRLVSKNISIEKIKIGPSVFDRKSSEKFIEKNFPAQIWVNDDNKLVCVVEREFSNARLFLIDLIDKKAEKSGIPKEIIKSINENGYTVN